MAHLAVPDELSIIVASVEASTFCSPEQRFGGEAMYARATPAVTDLRLRPRGGDPLRCYRTARIGGRCA
jgi:hypothetical protein